jgi:hypothetical protein
MKRFIVIAAAVLFSAAALATPAYAGSPHFVDDKATVAVDGDTLTVTFKEAGLGDEPQVHVVLTADAACVNPGGNKPLAANKQAFTAAGDFPVQNGRAEGSLSVTAVMDPDCAPPMTVEYSNVVLTDVTNGISLALL